MYVDVGHPEFYKHNHLFTPNISDSQKKPFVIIYLKYFKHVIEIKGFFFTQTLGLQIALTFICLESIFHYYMSFRSTFNDGTLKNGQY